MKQNIRKFKSLFIFGTALVFFSCNKEKIKNEQKVNPIKEVPKEVSDVNPKIEKEKAKLMKELLLTLDQKQYAYRSFVKVTDGTDENYILFKIYSNNKEVYDTEISRYQNSVLRTMTKDNQVTYNDLKSNSSSLEENKAIEMEIIEQNRSMTNTIEIVSVENTLENDITWQLHSKNTRKADFNETIFENTLYNNYGFEKNIRLSFIQSANKNLFEQLCIAYWPEAILIFKLEIYTIKAPRSLEFSNPNIWPKLHRICFRTNSSGSQVKIRKKNTFYNDFW